jgi:hypothetical protein
MCCLGPWELSKSSTQLEIALARSRRPLFLILAMIPTTHVNGSYMLNPFKIVPAGINFLQVSIACFSILQRLFIIYSCVFFFYLKGTFDGQKYPETGYDMSFPTSQVDTNFDIIRIWSDLIRLIGQYQINGDISISQDHFTGGNAFLAVRFTQEGTSAAAYYSLL